MNTYLRNLILTTALLMYFANTGKTQNCGIELLQEQIKYMDDTRIERANTNISLLSEDEEIANFPLAIHIVRDSAGEQGLHLDSLDAAIEDLNNAFEPVNFRFNVCCINYIDDDTYADGTVAQGFDSSSIEYQMATPHLVPNLINIFFIPVLSNPNHNGWSSFPAYKFHYEKDWTVLKNSAANNGSTLPHEMGHYFSLYHTHQGSHDVIGWGDELVNGSNCGPGVGDEICDTPADATGLAYNDEGNDYHIGFCTDYYSCEFNGTNTELPCSFKDSNGQTYRPSTTNVMSYNYAHCRTQFSPQQSDRMQRSYLFERDYLSNYCEVTCDNMFTVYDWLKAEAACSDITIYYYNDVFNYLDIQNGSERNLYLSTGDLYCSGSTVEACITELGLTEILAECSLPCDRCTDTSACNYGEAEACIYSDLNCPDPCNENTCVEGCTDSSACNFNPDANVEDNTCQYGNLACPEPCSNCTFGCNDPNACNYDESATVDDNSCTYPEPNYNCNGVCEVSVDCENVCGGNTISGTACDDGDDSTRDDKYNDECICEGIKIDTPTNSCMDIFNQYSWIENEVSFNQDEISLYSHSSGWNFIEINTSNNRKLFLSDGTLYCSGTQVEVCKESFGLYEPIEDCICCAPPEPCDDPNACNFNAEEPCEYGNSNCPNPCDECTYPVASCDNIFAKYAWLSALLPCEDEVSVYAHNSGWEFIEIKVNNTEELYLSDGTPYCSGTQVEVCKESFGLTNPIDNCVCEDKQPSPCEDQTACNFGEEAPCEYGNEACNDPCDESTCADCNKHTGTVFYQDCGGTTFRFIETTDGQIFDPYFDLIDQEAYEGQRIKFDFMDNDIDLPCDVAEKAITLTCLEIIEDEIPEPDCNNYTGTIFYEDCGGTTYRFLETADGQIYDPYFHLVDLEIYEGQRIKFDFIINNDVVTPCDIAKEAITITCIEEIEIQNDEDCDDFFVDFPWLYNKVDPNNCNGETITVFSNGTYYFIYISQPNNGDLFLDAGYNIPYGYDNGDYSLPEAYNIEEIAKWTCGCNSPVNQAKTNKFAPSNQKKDLTDKQQTFNLYPNPSKGKVYISFADNPNANNLVTVYDISGKPLLKQELDSITATLDLSHLPNGIYLVEVLNVNDARNTHNTQSKSIQKLLIE